jgi:RND family efflux transporter MFP subunit
MSRILPLLIGLGAWPIVAVAQDALVVEVIRAEARPTISIYTLTGTIEAAETVPVGPREGGRIIEMPVQIGDRVAAGDVLVRLDPTQATAAVQAAEAQLAAADAALRQARQARDRAEGLAAQGAGTMATLDSATEALQAAQAQRDQTAAQLAKVRQSLEDTVLVAKAPGMVTARSAEPGQVAGAAQTVLTLASDAAPEAVFHAPDGVDLQSYVGTKVRIRTLDTPVIAMMGDIIEAAPIADSATGTVRVKVRLPADAGVAGLGTAVASEVELPQPPTFSLPWTALATYQGQPAVWTVDPATSAVALTAVEIERFTSTTIEIGGGLAPGAMVVGAGSQFLFPGRIVAAAGETP